MAENKRKIIKKAAKVIVDSIINNIKQLQLEQGKVKFYLGLNHFLLSGKRILDLALTAIGIYWLLEFYMYHIPIEMKTNAFFTMGYMLAILMIPFYYCMIYLMDIFGDDEK